ncbi:IS5 family transposase [Streptomyces mirabilis]|uniref:IS5 family transposase n=1 Tax=Streptomyces mirabilis TaxID=68239 RepID=UPI0033285858
MGRGDLSDVQWAVLEPLLPVAQVGRPSACRRRLIDGIRWRVRTGAPWRDLPVAYGPWQTVYGLFRRWQRTGVWKAVLTGLQAKADAAGLITWEVNVDSTICRAHQHAAGARRDGQTQKEPPGGVCTEPEDHALGRSRGGLTTKVHLASEQGQRPLSLLVTAGQRGDSPQFVAVLEGIRVPRLGSGRPRRRPLRVRGDKTPHAAVGSSSCRERS